MPDFNILVLSNSITKSVFDFRKKFGVKKASCGDDNVQFVGKRIKHEWIIRTRTGIKKWYLGSVLKLIAGVDGQLKSRYLIKYDGEENEYEIDHLVEDYLEGSVILL